MTAADALYQAERASAEPVRVLLQDECRGLSISLSKKPDAMRSARQAVADIAATSQKGVT